MATLSEHATAIRTAFEAARRDGFKIMPDVATVYYNGEVQRVELDLWDGVKTWINLDAWDGDQL